MRMEELSNSRYEKSTDSVEKYLLDIVQNYFKNQSISSIQSKEYIIKRAVARMKEEVDFESIGVLSITLPDGQKRIGAVSISLSDLGGEPLIQDKKTAFNVDFGDESGTACEGNDPRLSDSRAPLAHTHSIDDILNLEGEIASLNGKIDRLVFHDHDNKDVIDLIRYSGTKTSIDLIDVEKLQDTMDNYLTNIQAVADEYTAYATQASQDCLDAIDNANASIANLQSTFTTQTDQTKSELSTEINTKINNAIYNLNATMSNNYALKSDILFLDNSLNNATSVYSTTTINFSDVINANGNYQVNDGIPLKIHSLGPGYEPIVDVYIINNNKKYLCPFIVYDTMNNILGTINYYYDGTNIYIDTNCSANDLSNFANATVKIIYSIKGANV